MNKFLEFTRTFFGCAFFFFVFHYMAGMSIENAIPFTLWVYLLVARNLKFGDTSKPSGVAVHLFFCFYLMAGLFISYGS